MDCFHYLKTIKKMVVVRIKKICRKTEDVKNRNNIGIKGRTLVSDHCCKGCSSSKESVRSRVAMDFTGAVGRIVEDPQEATAIAVAEGYSWKRRWRGYTRGSAGPSGVTSTAFVQSLDAGIHMTQPWFHSGLPRDKATELVSKHGTVDGVFLVRDSRSSSGSYVITYKCGGKVIHAQVNPILDPLRDRAVYSIDNGVTKFYDLLQLVEFYQLNAGCLPTRLTHYVTFTLQDDTYDKQGEFSQSKPGSSH